MEKSSVSIKGRGKDIIEIRLDDKIDYFNLRDAFVKKLNSTKGFFHGSNPNIYILGRKLTPSQKEDIKRILDIDYNILNVKFFDELEDIEKELIVNKKNNLPKVKPSKTLYDTKSDTEVNAEIKKKDLPIKSIMEKKTLRNGQVIKIEGDYTLIGDVNVGAEIYATGNIAIFGNLRGLVHAGYKGDETCIVVANSMTPSQIRIASRIVAFPKKRKTKYAEIAKIEDGNIVVLPLMNKK